jgi:hypothetical protein
VSAQFSVRCFVRTPFCGPSLRSSPGLDIPNHRSTLPVRARFFVSAHAQFAPDLLRGNPRYVQVRAQHSGCRFMLPVRTRFFCECPVQRPIFCEDAFCEWPPPRSSPCPDDDPALYGAAAGAWSRARSRAAKSSHVLTMLRGAGKSLPRSFRLHQS